MVTRYKPVSGISGGGGASLQTQFFTVSNPPQNQFTLTSRPASDLDGDAVLKVYYNGMILEGGVDYTLSNRTISWISSIPLEAGEVLECFYSPAS